MDKMKGAVKNMAVNVIDKLQCKITGIC
ncbi:unnamed protein product [Staurois parvus]|uniref:Frog antimicrobial peptide brevinin-2/esculentin type domain-containing protein n=1 Tax=Staurois parvus TaxID=386267 RepID=A0ABN9ASQ5_9NEOB|nr:unnamed protein product [Staurois parvus]